MIFKNIDEGMIRKKGKQQQQKSLFLYEETDMKEEEGGKGD